MKKGSTGDGSNSYLQYGYCGVQGKRRKMEDRHVAEADVNVKKYKVDYGVSFFGVYDGHGGDETAEHLSKELVKTVFNQDVKENDKFLSDKFLTEGYLECDKKLRKVEDITEGVSGSTAITVVITNHKSKYDIICANVGDSRGILFHNGETKPLSKDHKPTKPKEKKKNWR